MGSVYEPVGFEGPEKKLEIDFQPAGEVAGSPCSPKHSLRSVPRSKWETILAVAQCNILSVLQNAHCDAYLLSESSMFVFDRKVMIKTCGTTSLLRTVPELMVVGQQLQLEIGFLQYSRTAFRYPEYQPAPHQSFRDEIAYLRQYLPEGFERVMADDHAIPPAQRMAWHVFTYDNQRMPTNEQSLEVCMFDLDPMAMRCFFGDDSLHGGDPVLCTHVSGIDDLLRAAKRLDQNAVDDDGAAPLVDAHLFSPCGYSMNALDGSTYYTIHITPENHCSYVSFETNAHLGSFVPVLRCVLETFRPARFQVAYVGDEQAAGTLAARDWPKHLHAGEQRFSRRDALQTGGCAKPKCSPMVWRRTGPYNHWMASSATYQCVLGWPSLACDEIAGERAHCGYNGWSSPVSGDSWSTRPTPSLCSDSERDLDDVPLDSSTTLDGQAPNISIG